MGRRKHSVLVVQNDSLGARQLAEAVSLAGYRIEGVHLTNHRRETSGFPSVAILDIDWAAKDPFWYAEHCSANYIDFIFYTDRSLLAEYGLPREYWGATVFGKHTEAIAGTKCEPNDVEGEVQAGAEVISLIPELRLLSYLECGDITLSDRVVDRVLREAILQNSEDRLQVVPSVRVALIRILFRIINSERRELMN
ncbi:hypothetical protein G0P98_25990 [Yangia sp. PrR004]|nr:hypothetical protein [Salipiger sp. PrR004]